MKYLILLVLLVSPMVSSHQWTPTYPMFNLSYVEGILQTKMSIFNTRQDVDYYEVTVLDEDMNPVDFATSDTIIHVPHLAKRKIDIYIRDSDLRKVVYICSTSKLLVEGSTGASVSSKICSKVKYEISDFTSVRQ